MYAMHLPLLAVLAVAGAAPAVAAPRGMPERRLCPEDAPEGVRLPPREGCTGAARAPSDRVRDIDGIRVRIGGRVGVDAGFRR